MQKPINKPIWKKNTLFFEHPDIYGISFDTRTIKPGDAFFALKATRDGHDFVKEAITKGAACAIVEREICEKNIIVDSVLNTLLNIAKLRREMLNATVFCITGSVGKTTTKEALHFYLDKHGKSYKSEGNFNNQLGLAYTLAQAPLDADYVVLELGTSEMGEIAELAKLAKPDYSIITHIAPAHFQNFKTLHNIVQEKSSLITYTKKMTFFNGDLWYSSLMQEIATQSGIKYKTFHNAETGLKTIKNAYELALNSLGFYITEEFNQKNVTGRQLLFEVKINEAEVIVIDSSYNANPASMLESIKFTTTLSNSKNKIKKIAILFSMTGLGEHSRRYHEMLKPVLDDFDLYLLGNEMLHLAKTRENHEKSTHFFETKEELIEALSNNINEHCIILIKGSKNELEQIANWFKKKVIYNFQNKNG